MAENIYMLPGNMNLNIKTGTVGYNNKILISDGKFSLEKNDKVNASVLESIIAKEAMPKVTSHKGSKVVAQPTHAHELSQTPTITHEEEKIALVLFLAGGFLCFSETREFTIHNINYQLTSIRS